MVSIKHLLLLKIVIIKHLLTLNTGKHETIVGIKHWLSLKICYPKLVSIKHLLSLNTTLVIIKHLLSKHLIALNTCKH